MNFLPAMLRRSRCVLVTGILSGLYGVVPAWAAGSSNSATYCCSDASGRNTCGDILPPACYDRAYSVMSGGVVIRRVAAPLTPEQRARKDAELRAQRERMAKEAEARRRDQVLLDSYANIGELERRRDREVGNVEGELRAIRAREADLMQQQDALIKRNSSKGNKVQQKVADELASVQTELEAIRSVIASKQINLARLKARFDADHARYMQLTQPDSLSVKPAPLR